MEKLNGYDALGSDIETILFQQDILADYVYWLGRGPGRCREPEIELTSAVLEDGLRVFCKNVDSHSRRGKRLLKETEEWFFSPDTDYVFAFENVCTSLGLNPDRIRRQILLFKAARRPLKRISILRRAAMAA